MSCPSLVMFLLMCACCVCSLELKRIIVLSRHNVRAPMIGGIGLISPMTWPQWSGNLADLTPKGRKLETIMGEYFAEYLKNNGLFEKCPAKSDVLVYANTMQRTKESARAFTKGAYPDCGIDVQFNNMYKYHMDPLFNPVVHNNSTIFRYFVSSEINKKLKELNLTENYAELENILDYKNSPECDDKPDCSFNNEMNTVLIKVNREPVIVGPITKGTSIVDAFLMAYYEGWPMIDVAWGKITKIEQWKRLVMIVTTSHRARFNVLMLSKDIAEPLLTFMTDKFINSEEKFVILYGHDSNIIPVLSALEVKEYTLHDQYEIAPVGGKLVFQKWFDDNRKLDLLKVEYVYQSMEQLREGAKLTLENPPQHVTLELEHCKVDKNGFCLWSDFVNLLNGLYKD